MESVPAYEGRSRKGDNESILFNKKWNKFTPAVSDALLSLAKCTFFVLLYTFIFVFFVYLTTDEPCYEKTGFLYMRKQRRRSAVR